MLHSEVHTLTEELRMLHAHVEFDRDHRARWEAAVGRAWSKRWNEGRRMAGIRQTDLYNSLAWTVRRVQERRE
jgi:hypothetical protein